MNQKFCNILVHACLQHMHYITGAVQAMEVPIVVHSIMVVGVLTCCALVHAVYVLKAAQMNEQCNLIQDFMLYKF